jgi:cholesterol transport system auxiliary component
VSPIRPLARRAASWAAPLAAVALAAGLAGCVSLLPKSKPAQLYRFAAVGGAEPSAAVTPPSTGLMLQAVTFSRAAQGDQILTVTGGQAAYIAEARWVSPAEVLFQEALRDRFDRLAARTRLLSRGEFAGAAGFLRVDVRAFEARYDQGPESPPNVVVEMRARINGVDGQIAAERTFAASIRAADNRVGPIADAYGRAVTKVLDDFTPWADQATPAARARPAPAVTTTTTTSTTTVAPPPPAPRP